MRLAEEARVERLEMGRLRRRATIASRGITQILETAAEYGLEGEDWAGLAREAWALAKALKTVERPAETALGVGSLEQPWRFFVGANREWQILTSSQEIISFLRTLVAGVLAAIEGYRNRERQQRSLGVSALRNPASPLSMQRVQRQLPPAMCRGSLQSLRWAATSMR